MNKYQVIYRFKNGIAIARTVNGGWCHIGPNGEALYKRRFAWIDQFFEGYAAVRFGGRYFHIDKEGNALYENSYEYVSEFVDGISKAKENGKYCHIGLDGQPLYDGRYDEVNSVCDGYVTVKDGDYWMQIPIKGVDRNGCKYSKGVVAEMIGHPDESDCIYNPMEHSESVITKPQIDREGKTWTICSIGDIKESGLINVSKRYPNYQTMCLASSILSGLEDVGIEYNDEFYKSIYNPSYETDDIINGKFSMPLPVSEWKYKKDEKFKDAKYYTNEYISDTIELTDEITFFIEKLFASIPSNATTFEIYGAVQNRVVAMMDSIIKYTSEDINDRYCDRPMHVYTSGWTYQPTQEFYQHVDIVLYGVAKDNIGYDVNCILQKDFKVIDNYEMNVQLGKIILYSLRTIGEKLIDEIRLDAKNHYEKYIEERNK